MNSLRGYLKKTGMTPQQFAAWMQVSPQKVWAWLRGDRVPNLSDATKMARLTNNQVPIEAWAAKQRRSG